MNDQTDNDTSSKEPIITNAIIDKLLKNPKDQTVEGKYFKYLGKGGEGVVFLCNEKVIKIYTHVVMNAILKEFYVVGLLQQLDKVNRNVIRVDKYYLSTSYPVMIMEHMDGNLSEWCDLMVNNKDRMTDKQMEITWLSMIFQVTYGLMFLNKLKILHNDTKSKNILYKKSNQNNTMQHYDVGNQGFNVPVQEYVFKIADFGAVQVLGSTMNTVSDEEIKRRLNQRVDLHELSRIWYRVLVNYGRNDYGWDKIRPIVDTNPEYKQYQKEQKNNLDRELCHMPQKIRDNMLLRALIYYGIENNLIDEKQIIEKYNLIKPSNIVLKTLDSLEDRSIRNVFDLFPMFKTNLPNH